MNFTEGQDVIFCNCQDVYLWGTKGVILEVHKNEDHPEVEAYTVKSELYNDPHFFPGYCLKPYPKLGSMKELKEETGFEPEYEDEK